MNYQKTGRILGMLFLLIVLIGAGGLSQRGLSTSLVADPDFLDLVNEQAFAMRISILADVLASAIGIFIAVFLYPLLKKHYGGIAIAYLALWVLQSAIAFIGDISHLSLISLSQEYTTTSAMDNGYHSTIGSMLVEDYFWSHFLSLIIYATGAWLLYFVLLKVKLVPQWLALWGMLAVTIVFTVTWLQIFDQSVSFNFYLQNGVFMICFIIWLLIKGFKNPIEPAYDH